MHLRRLEVADFRNHPAAAVDLPPGVSALVGANGSGKTNLLEAAGYLATLGSHRLGQDAALVRAGADAAVIRGTAVRSGRVVLLELEIRPGSGVRGRINRAPVPRSRELLGIVRAVLFAPEDLALIRGDPEERRRFLDTLAVQRLPRYLSARQDFDRILRQRNSLLRSTGGRLPSGASLAALDVWDEKLSTAAADLWTERLQLVRLLAPLVERAYQGLAGREDALEMTYSSTVLGEVDGPAPDPSELSRLLRERLAADRSREVERGITLSGPHRDELVLVLRGLAARTHASHGEAWSLALALRFASHQLLTAEGDEPLLLLDDVFAELDRARRERVAAAAVAAEQAIVTAAVAEEVPSQLGASMFHVEPGSIVPVSPP